MARPGSVRSFAPVAGPGARILVLGSMPGAASLAAGQYYAHPRNQFWRVMAAILGGDAAAPYRARLRMLKGGGIALWDVLKACVRPGSADSAIVPDSIVPNDVPLFLRRHRGIKLVCFNGSKAEECWRRHALALSPLPDRRIKYVRLPSTSPAHAAMPYARKLALWSKALASAGK